MKLNQLARVRYQVQFGCKWISYSGFFAGLMFLLLCIEYFGLKNLGEIVAGEVILSLALPLLILTGFAVMLRGFRCKVTPAYGVVAALLCLYMIIRAFSNGDAAGALFALIWYLLAGGIAVLTTFGVIPGRAYMVLAFLLPVLYRLIFVDINLYFRTKDFLGFIPEAAALSGLLAFAMFGLCLNAVVLQRKENE